MIASRRVTALAVLLAVALSLVVSSTPAVAAPADLERDFVERINQERTSRGLAALAVRFQVRDVARAHSDVMRRESRLHHNPNLASDIDNWVRLGENVGVGYSVSSLHRAFMDSPGHRANILSTNVTELGLGLVVEPSGRIWVTEVFRKPADAELSRKRHEALVAAETPPPVVPAGAQLLSGDWDGDGKATPGWYLKGIVTLVDEARNKTSFRYGRSGDFMVVGDWDGNGTDTVGIVRGNAWHLRNSNSSGVAHYSFRYGYSSDHPIVGDWNGDGKDTPGIVRGNHWYMSNSKKGGYADYAFSYGSVSDRKVVGDWNGDGRDTAGVVRGNTWHLTDGVKGGYASRSFKLGSTSDPVVTGDWAAKGRDGAGVARAAVWYLETELDGGATEIVFEIG